MKILRILSIVLLTACVVMQVLPYGIVISAANVASYHSYFDISAWASGIIGPFFCAIMTMVTLGMCIGTVFFEHQRNGYLLALEIVAWVTFAFSLTPLLYKAFTVVGGIISGILIFCAEVCHISYRNVSGKK